MSRLIFIYLIIIFSFSFNGCKKDNNDNSAATSLPELTTSVISAINSTTAQGGGTIISDGGGTITDRGLCWSLFPGPKVGPYETFDGGGTGSFISKMTGLVPLVRFYVRAYAYNSKGLAYGNEVSFVTTMLDSPDTVSDIDGNIYHTVTISNQTWMIENLKTTKFNDGTLIPNITDNNAWSTSTVPAYCWYENDASGYNKAVYGGLYNWYAVNTGKLCPQGWHVPSNDEWSMLLNNIGGEANGGQLKAMQWSTPNIGTSNHYNFWALPGGQRVYYGDSFYDLTFYGNWWSSTDIPSSNPWYFSLYWGSAGASRQNDLKKNSGLSVRCVKN